MFEQNGPIPRVFRILTLCSVNSAFISPVAHQLLGTCLRRIADAMFAAFVSSVSVSNEAMSSICPESYRVELGCYRFLKTVSGDAGPALIFVEQ